MSLTRWIPALACAALLSACGTLGKPPAAAAPAPAPIGAMLAAADEAGKLGQTEKTTSLLRAAAAAYPADKEPWIRLAQRSMEARQYRDALNHALEVLARDGEDRAALAIVVLSGSRVAGAAADQLARGPVWSGASRSEAQEVAKRLLASVGEAPRPVAPVRHTVLGNAAQAQSSPSIPAAPSAAAPAAAKGKVDAAEMADPLATLRKIKTRP